MKRSAPWDQSYPISSDSDSGADELASTKPNTKSAGARLSKDIMSKADRKKKHGSLDYEALSRHGYNGGLSVLKVPPPRAVEDKDQDWSWSNGKRNNADNNTIEESFEERERTRVALTQGEQLLNVQTSREKKNISFSQKEKRKRDLGQASRGKNYVEEEKRQLRENGVYSGFDS